MIFVYVNAIGTIVVKYYFSTYRCIEYQISNCSKYYWSRLTACFISYRRVIRFAWFHDSLTITLFYVLSSLSTKYLQYAHQNKIYYLPGLLSSHTCGQLSTSSTIYLTNTLTPVNQGDRLTTTT